MVIKVHLIKPKNKYIPTFYKTSQIKFQSLSIPEQNRFRTRSTQKILRYNNPWQLMTNQDITMLADRLQDKPQELYEVVKQNQRQKSLQYEQSRKLKFNKIPFSKSPQHLTNIYNNNSSQKRPYLKLSTNNDNSKKLLRHFSQASLSNMTENHHHSILSKINLKKLQYERQMSSLIKNKRLLLQTDLPKISKIKIIEQPSSGSIKFNVMGNKINGKLPVWKMR